MEHLGDSLLEMMHLTDKVCEILLVFNLRVFEKVIIQSADKEQDLAPVHMGRVSHRLHAFLSLLILELLRNVQILLVESLHDVGFEK